MAELVFDHADGRHLAEDLRNRLAARAAALRLENLAPWFGSLERDPVHPSVYYLAVDGLGGTPLLLHLAPASAPSSGFFPRSVLIARTRSRLHREIVVNAVPFGAADGENVLRYAAQVNRDFLPRPQGSRPAIVVSGPETALPAAFDAFRAVLKRTGRNVAALEPAGEAYAAAVWAAIRAGWREGYGLASGRLAAGSPEAAQEAVRRAPLATRFPFDIPAPAGVAAPALSAEDLAWASGEPATDISREEAARLAGRFGPALLAAERLFDTIREARAAGGHERAFDFELMLDTTEELTSPAELRFCLGWLKGRGRAAQFVAPNLGLRGGTPASLDEFSGRLKALAEAARLFHATLAVTPGESADDALMEAIGKATLGRVAVRLTAGEGGLRNRIAAAAAQLAG